MIPKPQQTSLKVITLEDAEKLIDENIEKNGFTCALVNFHTIAPDILTKLKAMYEHGQWIVTIDNARDGKTTRFKLS